jgi:hypothetical protein
MWTRLEEEKILHNILQQTIRMPAAIVQLKNSQLHVLVLTVVKMIDSNESNTKMEMLVGHLGVTKANSNKSLSRDKGNHRMLTIDSETKRAKDGQERYVITLS